MPGDVICRESIRILDTGASLNAHSIALLVIQGLQPVFQVTSCLRHRSSTMATDAGIEHPPIVDLSDYEERKEEITLQLMHAATTSGKYSRSEQTAHSLTLQRQTRSESARSSLVTRIGLL